MAKTAAWNLSGTNVRVNSICPGLIEVCPWPSILLYNSAAYRDVRSWDPLIRDPIRRRLRAFWFGEVGRPPRIYSVPVSGLLPHPTPFALPL